MSVRPGAAVTVTDSDAYGLIAVQGHGSIGSFDVEAATETYRAEAIELPAHEASVIVQQRTKSTPQLAEYVATAAPRVIPVFEINRY